MFYVMRSTLGNTVETGELAANAVTLAKVVAATQASVLLGRRSGSAGNFEEVTLGTGVAMSAAAVLSVSGFKDVHTAVVEDGDWTGADGARYFALDGSQTIALSGNHSNESDQQCIIPIAATASVLSAKIRTNTLDNTTAIVFRDDGADSSLTVTIGAGATGVTTTTGGSAAVAAGSLCNYKATPSGTGAANGYHFSVELDY